MENFSIYFTFYRHAEDTASQSYQQPVHNLTVFHRLLTHIPAGYTPVFYQKPRILFTTLWFITFVHSKKCTTFDLPKRKDAPRGNILQPTVDFPKIYYRWLQDTHYLRDQLSKKHPRLEPVTGSPSADFSFQSSLFWKHPSLPGNCQKLFFTFPRFPFKSPAETL